MTDEKRRIVAVKAWDGNNLWQTVEERYPWKRLLGEKNCNV